MLRGTRYFLGGDSEGPGEAAIEAEDIFVVVVDDQR